VLLPILFVFVDTCPLEQDEIHMCQLVAMCKDINCEVDKFPVDLGWPIVLNLQYGRTYPFHRFSQVSSFREENRSEMAVRLQVINPL
jgi:hypothetical protein